MRLSIIKALVLEALFIGCYFLLREYISPSGMPVWIAYGLLTAVALDAWAVWFKLRAVRHETEHGPAVLPANLVIMTFMAIIRVAVFSVMVLLAWETIVGSHMADSSSNWLIAAIAAKEMLILGILVSAQRKGHLKGKAPWAPWVFAADVVLVLSAEFVILLLDQLFDRPSLDTAWNPIFLLVMIGLYSFLFLLFVLPFRILYSFESLKGSDSAVLYEVGSILVMLGSMLWFSLYSSERADKHFLNALESRPMASEFSYQKPTRLKTKALETLCPLPLERLEMHCDYMGYVPPCIYEIKTLRDLDLQDNDFSRIELRSDSPITHLNLSGNDIGHLADLGFYSGAGASPIERLDLSYNQLKRVEDGLGDFSNLRWLDLSHNPLTGLSIAPDALPRLETLRLVGTRLSSKAIAALERSYPNLVIEH